MGDKYTKDFVRKIKFDFILISCFLGLFINEYFCITQSAFSQKSLT